jgi:hypothetical protein
LKECDNLENIDIDVDGVEVDLREWEVCMQGFGLKNWRKVTTWKTLT